MMNPRDQSLENKIISLLYYVYLVKISTRICTSFFTILFEIMKVSQFIISHSVQVILLSLLLPYRNYFY